MFLEMIRENISFIQILVERVSVMVVLLWTTFYFVFVFVVEMSWRKNDKNW